MYKPNEIEALKGLGIKLVHIVCSIDSDEHEVRLRRSAQAAARGGIRLFVLDGWSQLTETQRQGYTSKSYGEEMLSHADYVIAVITEDTPESASEVMRACELGRPVLPVFPRNPENARVGCLQSYVETKEINRRSLLVGPGEILTKTEFAGEAVITELRYWARIEEPRIRYGIAA